MKRWILLALCVTPLLAGTSFLACGGGDDSVASGGDGGADGTVAGDDGGGGGGDDGGGGGGGDGATGEGGGKGDGGGGGGGSNPGQISCGAATCSAASQLCCDPLGDAGPECREAGANCNGLEFQCDETADCDAGNVCCLELAPPRARCRNNCTGPGRYEECKLDSECGDGGACKAYTCQGGVAVKTCKKPPGCN